MGLLKAEQKGVSLTGLLVVCVILGVVGILAAKIVPEVIEYYSILKDVKATAQDPGLRGARLQDIKIAYAKRASIDNITAIAPDDLDISKDGDEIVIEFAYSKKIPLFANASLVLDFAGSSSQQKDE